MPATAHPSAAHTFADRLRERGIFVALGAYTAMIGAGWIALAASFQ